MLIFGTFGTSHLIRKNSRHSVQEHFCHINFLKSNWSVQENLRKRKTQN